ncbi:MAG: hypothetical protein J7L91_03690 [Candidatus Korarchaeota archaeon]|nr:hypothetical protein [Candidatus Korarchaeota archaeon]
MDLEGFVERSLRNLLVHAHDKVRYYRPVLEEAGVIVQVVKRLLRISPRYVY